MIFVIFFMFVALAHSQEFPETTTSVPLLPTTTMLPTTTQSPGSNLTGFALANNYFGLNLLRQLSTGKENVFFSPYSVSIALAMLYQGTGTVSNSSNQLEEALGYQLARLSTGNRQELAQQIREVDTKIEVTKNESHILRSSNALVSSQDIKLLDTYKETLSENFRAELFPVDFSGESAKVLDLINNWVSNQTSGKIPKILAAPLPSETKLALINAVYFKGSWVRKFRKSHNSLEQFYNLDGQSFPQVEFMNIPGKHFKLARTEALEGAAVVELPYQGDDVSFYGILPFTNQTSALSQLKMKLTPETLEEAITSASERFIHLKLPKFSFKVDYDLIPSLTRLGIKNIFDFERSDFTNISPDLDHSAVSVIKHAANIEVNEEGSEAAAATLISITRTSLVVSNIPPKQIWFNRPFLFLIRHQSTGQILFIGEINKF